MISTLRPDSMHEMSIAQSVVDIIQEEVSRRGVRQLRAINLIMGRLSAVVPSHLALCFEIITKNTLLEGTTLNIREVPLGYQCPDCGKGFSVAEIQFTCPDCGESNLKLTAGRELAVESIEVFD